MQVSRARGEETGLTDEELALYGALAAFRTGALKSSRHGHPRLCNLRFVAGRRSSATLAQRKRDLVAIVALLDMRGIGARQRTMQPIFGAVGVDPVPDIALLAFGAGDVDGTAMAITAGAAAAAV